MTEEQLIITESMLRELDEQNLARLCSDNNRCAQEELYARYADRLYTLCLRYSGNSDDAQDLVHDSFLNALEKIPSFIYSGKGSLYAWLSRIAINKALTNIGRYKFRYIHLPDLISVESPELPEEEVVGIPQNTLLEFISELPDTQRAIFNLFCLDGYSHKEISNMLGISENGSTSMLFKAKARLKKRISQYIKNNE